MAKPPKRPGGTPPKEHQFKPGQSGNPGGRPKGRPTARDVFGDELARSIPVQLEHGPATVSALEAIMRGLVAHLIRNPKDAIRVFNLTELSASDEPDEAPLSDDDQALLDDLARRISKRGRPRDV